MRSWDSGRGKGWCIIRTGGGRGKAPRGSLGCVRDGSRGELRLLDRLVHGASAVVILREGVGGEGVVVCLLWTVINVQSLNGGTQYWFW